MSKHLRPPDAFIPPCVAADNPTAKKLIWPWLRKNWPDLLKRYGEGGSTKMLERLAESLICVTDKQTEMEIRAFFKKHPCPAIKKCLSQILERIQINRWFVEKSTLQIGREESSRKYESGIKKKSWPGKRSHSLMI